MQTSPAAEWQPRLCCSLFGVRSGLLAVICIELALCVCQLLVCLSFAVSVNPYPMAILLVLIGFGVWALVWLYQARSCEQPNKTCVYMIWKSVVVALQMLGMSHGN